MSWAPSAVEHFSENDTFIKTTLRERVLAHLILKNTISIPISENVHIISSLKLTQSEMSAVDWSVFVEVNSCQCNSN